jgi:hypothetical protein
MDMTSTDSTSQKHHTDLSVTGPLSAIKAVPPRRQIQEAVVSHGGGGDPLAAPAERP